MSKTIRLTDEQYHFLCETLMFHSDEGPEGEGWKSAELEELCAVIERAAAQPKRRVSGAAIAEGAKQAEADAEAAIKAFWDC